MGKNRKCFVVVKTQEELDRIAYNDHRNIIIEFGDKEQPAIISTAFESCIYITKNYHACIYSGIRVFVDDHAHVQVANGCVVSLRDFGGCEVYGASYVCGRGNSKIYLLSDKATIERLERNRMYRRKP